jgi:hypothetical protein
MSGIEKLELQIREFNILNLTAEEMSRKMLHLLNNEDYSSVEFTLANVETQKPETFEFVTQSDD